MTEQQQQDITEDQRDRRTALAQLLDVPFSDVRINEEEQTFEIIPADGGNYPHEYFVLTEEEAEARHEAELDHYLDEVIYPEIPEYLHFYFDEELWKTDARTDDRGTAISHYDGMEHDETVNGIDYCIFRVN